MLGYGNFRIEQEVIMKILKSKFFKFSWPFLFLLAIWFAFSFPYFFLNKVPFPSAYQVNHLAPWSAYPEFASPVKNSAIPDVVGQIYPWKKLVIDSWSKGEVPLWNPYILSGTPLLANYQSASLSPLNLLFFVMPFIDAWSLLVLMQPILAGIFMYLLARNFQQSKFAALISAIAFMLSGFIVTWMSYATLGYAILFLPLSILALEKYFEKKSPIWLFVLSVSIPLSFLSGHFQISLYFLIFVMAYLIFKALTVDPKKAFSCIVFVFFGLLLSMPQLLPSMELYSESLRSNIFLKSEEIPYQYIVTLLAPDFFGNPVSRNNWFGHYAEWNAFIGIIPLFLAVYSFFGKKNARTIFLFLTAIMSLFMAFDTPIANLIYALKIPVLSTSTAGRIVCLFIFSACLITGFGFDRLVSDLKNKKFNSIFLILAMFSSAFFAIWLILALKIAVPLDKIPISRQNLIFPTLIWVLFLSTVALWIFSKSRRYLLFSLLVLLILALDLLRFAQKWQPFDPRDMVFPEIQVTKEFKKISGYDRVLGNIGGEVVIYYGLPTIDGYDPLYIKRYGELISSLSNGKISESERSIVKFPKRGDLIWEGLDFLGVKYVIHKFSDGRNSWTFPFWEKPGQFKERFNDGHFEIYENVQAMPRVMLTGKSKNISDGQQTIDSLLKDKGFNKEVILEEGVALTGPADIGKAVIKKYDPNKVEIYVNATESGYLLLTDSYYPGWTADLDGKPIRILKGDYAFRAIKVEPGQHTVKMTYQPESFKRGVLFAEVGGLAILISLFVPKILSLKTSSSS